MHAIVHAIPMSHKSHRILAYGIAEMTHATRPTNRPASRRSICSAIMIRPPKRAWRETLLAANVVDLKPREGVILKEKQHGMDAAKTARAVTARVRPMFALDAWENRELLFFLAKVRDSAKNAESQILAWSVQDFNTRSINVPQVWLPLKDRRSKRRKGWW